MARSFGASVILPLAIVMATASVACPRARGPHEVVGGESKAALNARCASCHAAQARTHQGSKHALAYVDPVFREAFALEPEPFCLGCHAPEQDPARKLEADAAIGIACTTCHPGGARAGAADASDAPCARCHEFPFPGEARLLQSTVSEHARGSRRHVRCVDCHARAAGGALDHGFVAASDSALLRGAARISARRDGDALVVRFERAGVGHALPTGDVFRRLRVRLVGRRGAEVVTIVRALSRKAKLGPAADDRPFADGADVAELRVPLAGATQVDWDVRYERVARPLDLEEREAVVVDGVELAQGRVE